MKAKTVVWDKPRIQKELKRLHQRGQNISYNALAKSHQSLVSAAAYHFGSYRTAVEKAGIEYSQVVRRPRWTKQGIIALIKGGRRKNQDLHWSAVTKRRDELGKAAFASLQPRLFGRWDRALQAAGLDADEISRYRKWDRSSVVAELKEMRADGADLSSGAVQKEDSGLHAAAVRHFGTYDKALQAAKIEPMSVRRRRSWTKDEVVSALKSASRSGQLLSDSALRKQNAALYGAAVRLFGTFTTARDAAKVKYKRAKK